MTFCGYNETMAAGLRTLVEGMIEAMLKRHAKGIPLVEVVQGELRDLQAMNVGLETQLRGSSLLPGLTGINLFAQTIFSRALPEAIDARRFAAACRKHGEEFIDLVRLTEERHQQELECGNEGVQAINSVAQWLMAGEAQDRAAAA